MSSSSLICPHMKGNVSLYFCMKGGLYCNQECLVSTSNSVVIAYVRKKLYGQVSSSGPELHFIRQNSSPIVNDSCSIVNNGVVPAPIVPTQHQSQVDNLPVALNEDTSSPGTQAQSSHPSLQPLSSSPDHLSQTSASTPPQSLPPRSARSSPAVTDQ